MLKLGQSGRPTRLHHGGGVLLGNDGRTHDHITSAQVLTQHQSSLMPLATGVHGHAIAHLSAARQFTRWMDGNALLGRRIPWQHRLHRHRLHHQDLARHEERKALLVGLLERADDTGERPKLHHQRRVRALVAHMHPPVHAHLTQAELLARQLLARSLCQCIKSLRDLCQ